MTFVKLAFAKTIESVFMADTGLMSTTSNSNELRFCFALKVICDGTNLAIHLFLAINQNPGNYIYPYKKQDIWSIVANF